MASPPLETLGRYRLVRVLGRGAMGVVYEALDERLGRTVAIKTVLRSHLDNESTAQDYAARFVREAQAAARLTHPNIVAVYDFGEQDDLSYIVMEFVSGRELADLFRSGHRFTLVEALQIMSELLDALAYAHGQGVVHRDVKPANVLVDRAGRVKLADFGVARLSSGNQDRTMPGTMVGTPNYMSPEQILGQPVGSRTDIFAAGVVLYQFLTGRQPFEGGGMFIVQRRILQEEPTPPSQVFAGLPPVLDRIVSRALAKQPEERYETAAAFAQDLRRLAADYLPTPPLPAAAGTPGPAGSAAVDLQLDIASPAAVASPAPQSWVSPQSAPTGVTRRRAIWPYGLGLGLASAALAAWWLLQTPAATPVMPAATSPAARAAASAPVLPAAPPTAPVSASSADTPAAATPAAAEPMPPPAPGPARPAPAPKAERPEPRDTARPAPTAPAGSMRCADILERMQLGEPLSAEQSSFFQSRCTR
jgi:tRNA A-37 threonylcarbamoyl transferase component Bud32